MARSTSTAVTEQKGGAVTTLRKGGKVSTVQKGGAITTTRKGGEVTAVSRTAVDKAVLESISGLLSEAKGLYAPGGGYMAGIEAQLSRGRTRAVTGGMQGLAAAGLASTSMAGGLARKYEEEVAAPTMAQATTQRLAALAGLAQTEAGFQAQLASRETTQRTTTAPLTTEQITSPRLTEQITSPLTTEQVTAPSTATRRTSSWASTPQAMSAPSAPAIRRPTQQAQPAQQAQQAQPRPTQARQPTRQPLPPNPIAKAYAPAGQWQATIGGTSFYSTGTGGYTQKLTSVSPTPAPAASAPKKPLSSYYGGSLMQQADPYNLSGMYS